MQYSPISRRCGRQARHGLLLSRALLSDAGRPCLCVQSSASKLLKETCSYIKSLHREVDDLSERLSGLMSTMDNDSPQAEIIRSLLR